MPIDLKVMLPLQEEGAYRFRLEYTHYTFTTEELRQLREARIEVPLSDAESQPVTIEFYAGRITLLAGAMTSAGS